MQVAHGKQASTSKEAEGSTSLSLQVANPAVTDVSVSGASHNGTSEVLLATAVVVVEDDDGNQYPARALLDSGSESNFISERLSHRLRAVRDKVAISVLGIGQAATTVKRRIRAVIRSRVGAFSREMSFLVLPKVTVNLPTSTINNTEWTIPQWVKLADPSYCVSSGADIVLGIEAFFDFFETGRRISLGVQMPILKESVLGWVVCGGLLSSKQSLNISCNVSTSEELEDIVARFWSCEEVEFTNSYSPEVALCEQDFTGTVRREESGRYTVSLPVKEGVLSRLGASKEIATRRLHGTERRLARDDGLREQYTSFMEEYLRLGHMQKVDEDDLVKRCYLPHHLVLKEDSTTTKLRVVFDASCKTSTGVSLNDALLTGPVIQEDLRSIMLRCRTKQVMLASDVEKCFDKSTFVRKIGDYSVFCSASRQRRRKLPTS